MIKTKSIVLFSFFTFLSTAQFTIVPLEQYGSERKDKYFKDVNDILEDYAGIWRWHDGNGRELFIYLYKQEGVNQKTLGGDAYKRDVIVGYYIYKENNIELLNTRIKLIENFNSISFSVDVGGIGMTPTKPITQHEPTSMFFRDFSSIVCFHDQLKPAMGSACEFVSVSNNVAAVALCTNGIIMNTCGVQEVVPNFPRNIGLGIERISTVAPPLD